MVGVLTAVDDMDDFVYEAVETDNHGEVKPLFGFKSGM
jgi:hypothetical protein